MTLERKPIWLRRRFPPVGGSCIPDSVTREKGLHTVCSEARCPNRLECYSKGTATFLLLGPNCTRRCTFCCVGKGRVDPPDASEPIRTAEAAALMGLSFFVITMVSRDDLSDGGAWHVASTVEAMREKCPDAKIELLLSDLAGNWDALEHIVSSDSHVINHNLETCARLYAEVRPQADYRRSLQLLNRAAHTSKQIITKSGLMLGLGETRDEVLWAMDDLRDHGCRLLTMGQYLAPSTLHHPVIRYVPPEEFEELRHEALARGFDGVAAGPLVRSSYQAHRLYLEAYDNMLTCLKKGLCRPRI